MIALHFQQFLQDNGFGVIGTDLWYGQLPLGDYDTNPEGIAVIEAGGSDSLKGKTSQIIELWAKGCNGRWPQMSKKLQAITNFIKCNCICKLPLTVDGCCEDTHDYGPVTIRPVGAIENLGLDSENNMLFRMRFEIIYKNCN